MKKRPDIIATMALLILLMIENAYMEIGCRTEENFIELQEDSNKKPCREKARETCTRFGTIRVAYFEMRPFVLHSPSPEHPSPGIIKHIMKVALDECCGTCAQVNEILHNNHTHLTGRKARNETDVRFPVFFQGKTHSSIIPLIRLSGAVFIIKSALKATQFGMAVFRAIKDIWPLLGLSLLMAYISGVIMWIADTWSNEDHFPRSFIEGSFEGFWWSFISMTTVGYGDRSPKSVQAKVFAVFWILCGLTIISLTTAALTTAIDTVSQQLRPSIEQGNVGILENHLFEKSILMKGNANITYKRGIRELIQSLDSGDIDGILVDSYTIKSFQELLLKTEGFYIDKVIEEANESYLSVAIDDKGLYELISQYIEYQSESISAYIDHAVPSNVIEGHTPRVEANIIFTTDSGIFKPILMIVGGVTGLIIVVGIIYELCSQKKNKVRAELRRAFHLTPKNLRKEEKRMEKELLDMLSKWDEEILELIDNYSIQALSTNSTKATPNVMVKLRTSDCSAAFFSGETSGAPEGKHDNNFSKSDSLPDKPNYHRFRNESITTIATGDNIRLKRPSVSYGSRTTEMGTQTTEIKKTKTKKKVKQKQWSEMSPMRPLPPILTAEESLV